jgi:hypothetical protein
MWTPVVGAKTHPPHPQTWDDARRDALEAERPRQSGWGLVAVLLVSLALWAGIILGIQALIAAL